MRSNVASKTPPNTDDATVNIGGDLGTTPGGASDIPSGDNRPESSESIPESVARVKPPKGYPDSVWLNDGTFEVAVELRAEYVRQANAGVGSTAAWRNVPRDQEVRIPNDDGGFSFEPIDYETWAHILRRDAARAVKARSDAVAEHIHRTHVSCVVCGTRDSYLSMRRVQIGDVDAYACPADAPSLEFELRSRQPIAPGRSRADAVRAAADRLMPDGTLPPLELRDRP